MKTICLSTVAWLNHAEATCKLLHRIVNTMPHETTTINVDLDTVLREVGGEDCAEAIFHSIDLSEWVNEGLKEGGVLNPEAVRRDVYAIPDDRTVIVVATGFPLDLLVAALRQFRLGMYPRDEWPKAVVFVCDDQARHQVMGVLAHSFYIRPSVMVTTAIRRQVRNLQLDARITRWIGHEIGSFARFVRRMASRRFAKNEARITERLGRNLEE